MSFAHRMVSFLKDSSCKSGSEFITEINYWPIFSIAHQIMRPIPDGPASQILNKLATVSSELAASGITRSHDLSGRLFQRLIADRKFLATFYTLPESATLLAELAGEKFDLDWSDREAVENLRVGDLASGTGTLLAAAYHSILARYRRSGGDDREIHATMMENALVAADIMPAATTPYNFNALKCASNSNLSTYSSAHFALWDTKGKSRTTSFSRIT